MTTLERGNCARSVADFLRLNRAAADLRAVTCATAAAHFGVSVVSLRGRLSREGYRWFELKLAERQRRHDAGNVRVVV